MEKSQKKVLVVEDEASIRKFLAINLNRSGFQILECESGEEALKLIEGQNPAVAVLDVMLPGMDGFELCQRLRELIPEIIIIMLTAKGQDMDKIMGLELGADDYMVKPFNPLELIARIRANLRKTEVGRTNNHKFIRFQELSLDLEGQRFYKQNIEIELTPTEFAIMKVLMTRPSKAFSRDEILNKIWGENYFGDMKTVDVHIRRIREKIENNPSEPQWVETVWGLGYRLRGAENNEEY
ncbi:DNA-binding response regulator, OmpR family, contains REC and winged-helix (wHTH) domain [Anaerovirgula multivorans]|uniref:Stage 0 sporulation protein A homolog n=1 Tax=Anaerovirgula multivorans TaxID=312168 RepID=A0A239BSE9_9FIRM|nr:response regulator transcription factor [Anaerovirgula multivorans]SNS10975.1 DNA-binding response regulator, OmpR family, contains REC and winged-helix (wHTH) domain [Anaerovirgula multivorans]